MIVHLLDHMGPLILTDVTKIQWVTKEWYGERETRMVIHRDNDVIDRHIDDIVKIENSNQ